MSVYKPTYREKRTGKVKQSRVWWYHFRLNGSHVQESSHSARKTVAIEAEKERRRELEKDVNNLPREKPQRRIRTVHKAIEEYQANYAVSRRATSATWVQERLAHVDRILGRSLVADLREAVMTGYMTRRLREKVGNRTVNMEISCLARAIGRPWSVLWPGVKPLEEPKDVGRALSTEEEKALLDCAAKNQSPVVLPFIRIALLTGMRFGEIRNLRWNQIDLLRRTLTVGRAKTRAGTGRPIPMSAEVYSVFAKHAVWIAQKLGPLELDWYVFPFSNRRRPVDPARPLTTIKTAWETVRVSAGVECRFHDLRHTAYTKMVEAGVPEGVIMALMGHVSRSMVERYSHVRMEAMRKAVETLSLAGKTEPEPDGFTLAKEMAKDDGAAQIN